MIRYIFTFVALAFSAHLLQAEAIDSLIVGINVKNAETKAAVKAQIRYELLPYGSKLGIRQGSACEFRMEQGEEYTVYVSADGYLPANIKISYNSYAGAGKINQEVNLTPMAVGKLMRLESLTFAVASAVVNPEAYDELDKLVKMLQANPQIRIQLEGHTDYQGDAKLNMKLSEDRVKSTRDYLEAKGITRDRIEVKAFGGTKPLSKENTTEGHTLNRRVEVRILTN